jgi:long-chain acyl-CoA synthetase
MSWSPPQRLLHESLLASADAEPGKVALLAENETRTYAELLDDALRLARVLQNRGLKRGDRVALFLDNTAELPTGIFATLLAGGVFMVVNPQTKADKLAYMLRDSEASLLLADSGLMDTAVEAGREAPSLAGTIASDDLPGLMSAAEPKPEPPGTIPPDLAALIYTSGSTGQPKGVMMTHEAMVFAAGSIAQYLRLVREDRIMNVLPLAFDYGLYQLLMAMRIGGTLVLERSFAFPAKTLQRIDQEQVTVFPGVPTVFATLLGMKQRSPHPSVRCVTNTAAGLPPSFHDGLGEIFPNALIFRMYGLTECKRVSYLEPELVEEKPTSVGRPIPGTEAFVLDEDGQRVGPGETGILYVRGPHVMAGYWNLPDQTAEMLKEGPVPGERMLCTQDHFTIDEDGFLYFVGRTDDIIKTRGEKVSPLEVENALHALEGISQAAVVGVPDDVLGEAIRAFVVLDEGAELSEQDIIRACRERLENFMVPRDVVLMDELPQTDTGKVRKKSLVGL